MNAIILSVSTLSVEANNSTGYILGGVIAILILGYLVYSLIKPEDF